MTTVLHAPKGTPFMRNYGVWPQLYLTGTAKHTDPLFEELLTDIKLPGTQIESVNLYMPATTEVVHDRLLEHWLNFARSGRTTQFPTTLLQPGLLKDLVNSTIYEITKFLDIDDREEFAGFLEDLWEENNEIFNDLRFASYEIHDYTRSRNMMYRIAAEKTIDHGEHPHRNVYIKIFADDLEVDKKCDLMRELVTHMAGKNPAFVKNIIVGVF